MDKQRLLAIALSVTLVLGLSACGAKPAETVEPQEPDTSMSEPVNQADTSEPDAQETAGGEDAGTVEPVNSIAPVEAVDPVEADSGWTEVNETVYAVSTVNVRSGAGADTDKIGSLAKGESVTRTGVGTDANAGWSRVEFSGAVSYISSDYLSTEKPVVASGNGSPSGGSGGNATINQDSQDSSQTTEPVEGNTEVEHQVTDEEFDRLQQEAEAVGGWTVPGYGGGIQFDPDDLM